MTKSKVLVIDSKDWFEKLFRNGQKREDWEFISASTKEEAIAILKQGDIGAVVLGCDVAGIDITKLPEEIALQFGNINVIINGGARKTCNISRKDYIRSQAFDFLEPAKSLTTLFDRIEIALTAGKMGPKNLVVGETA